MDSQEPDISGIAPEGINTLAAQTTRQSVDRILSIIRAQRAKGVSAVSLAKAMERSLGDFDKHSRDILLKIAFDEEVPDDFPPSIIEASEQLKPNTIELTLKAFPKDMTLFSMVWHKGTEWLVVASQGNNCTLKMLQ